jgi:NADPH-dependent ferric siderophore reductase
MAARRYEYEIMTAQQLSDGLNAVGLTMREFCRISGVRPDKAERWLNGEETNIAPWVGALLGAMTVPEAREIVRAYTLHSTRAVL